MPTRENPFRASERQNPDGCDASTNKQCECERKLHAMVVMLFILQRANGALIRQPNPSRGPSLLDRRTDPTKGTNSTTAEGYQTAPAQHTSLTMTAWAWPSRTRCCVRSAAASYTNVCAGTCRCPSGPSSSSDSASGRPSKLSLSPSLSSSPTASSGGGKKVRMRCRRTRTAAVVLIMIHFDLALPQRLGARLHRPPLSTILVIHRRRRRAIVK
ncbi:hypothetical protein B0H11DRAFT_2009641 [Mycena galericulata]|nr:hypothetical protein B0H11DRAFT_2009641 [Mycena galericulata]